MPTQQHPLYSYILEAPLSIQIMLLFALAMTAIAYGYALRSVFIIVTGTLQKAKVIGFKRRTRKIGKLVFPRYDPIVTYEDSYGTSKQAVIRKVYAKSMSSIEVFITKKTVEFVDLNNLGLVLFCGSFITYIWLLLFREIDLLGSKLSLLAPFIVVAILMLRNISQYHFADKSFLPIRMWKQRKADLQITKIDLTDDEYKQLITPDSILSYAEVKRLEKKETRPKAIIHGIMLVLFIGLLIWDILA